MRNARQRTFDAAFGAAALALILSGGLPFLRAADTTAPEVTLSSLLQEMTNREAVARWSLPAYTLQQASSHDRRKTDPAHAETWHSNVDYGQFLGTETNQDRHEWVIMEENGPGAITRFWTPLLAENDKQTIRFYFDGSPTPAISVRFNEFLSGQAFVRPPLAFFAWNETDLRNQLLPEFKPRRGVAGDLYLPIPFGRSCKITLDSLPFYYVINYRRYEPGTKVRSFTMVDWEAAKPAIERTSEALVTLAKPRESGSPQMAKLKAGQELRLTLPAGPAAIRQLQVEINPQQAPQVLRSTILQVVVDGESTIWCPLGEFFGAGFRLNPVEDWWRTVGADGKLSARWIMPYERSVRLSLRNYGSEQVIVKLAAVSDAWRWDDQSLHFHGTWRGQLGLATRPMSDWNYLEAHGQGRYVGDTLTVFSPVKAWYGEGDERIYFDGATVPAHIGTGTEDYYGYAWGMAGFFNSPFISMPRRDMTAQDDWRGYTTTSRLRLLDSIPFRTSLKHDLEIWNWADTQVDYAVGTFWYARPGARHNHGAQPRVVTSDVRPLPGDFKMAGAIECETLPLAAKSPDLRIESQGAGLSAGQWSGGRQLFVQATNAGAFVEFELPVADSQPRLVTLYGTKSFDYGILRFSVNGQRAGSDYDAYHPTAAASGALNLGQFKPQDGRLVLRVEVVGANPASKGSRYFFGLDCVLLRKP